LHRTAVRAALDDYWGRLKVGEFQTLQNIKDRDLLFSPSGEIGVLDVAAAVARALAPLRLRIWRSASDEGARPRLFRPTTQPGV
jgi:hypothetical protein